MPEGPVEPTPVEPAEPAREEEPLQEPVEEQPTEPEQPQKRSRFNAGEPVYLYVKTSATTYDNVGEFNSRVDASRAAEADWKGHKYKTLTASEAVAEQQRLQARAERVSKTMTTVGSGLKRVARNLTHGAEREARGHGMLPPERPSKGQTINVNVNTGSREPTGPSDDEYIEDLRKFGRHMNRSFNPASKDFSPPTPPMSAPQKRFNVQTPRSSFHFSPPPSPMQGSRHTFVPPPTPIRSSQHRLKPPVHSQRKYGVVPRHGQHMLDLPYAQQRQQMQQPGRRMFRIPVYRNPMLHPQQFYQAQPVMKKKVHSKRRKK